MFSGRINKSEGKERSSDFSSTSSDSSKSFSTSSGLGSKI
ncbi:hypothetical protein CP8484711_0754 [Chlamydia psittaci 84-8471/1]|nr:hypothetical protein CP8484711_0754 [Chlamydia psittaci 84-8471/1]